MPKTKPFEEYSQIYNDWFVKNNNLYLSELNAIREFIPPNKKGIEIGIGTGMFALPLGIKIGIDPSPKMSEASRIKGLEVYEATAENLPFEKELFDFVLMVTVVCFFDDVLQAFKEAFRILKPDGFIIIGFIDKNSKLGQVYENNKLNSKFYKEATFYSVNEITAYLKNASFKKFEYKQTLFTANNIIQNHKDGYGEGSFVVIKALKYG